LIPIGKSRSFQWLWSSTTVWDDQSWWQT